MGEYVCVVLLEKSGKESQTVVPSNWVKNGLVYWSNKINARRQYDECAEIEEGWASYRFVKELVRGDEEVCVEYLHTYQSSAPEDSPKKKSCPRKRSPSKKLPTPPSKKANSFHNTSASSSSSYSDTMDFLNESSRKKTTTTSTRTNSPGSNSSESSLFIRGNLPSDDSPRRSPRSRHSNEVSPEPRRSPRGHSRWEETSNRSSSDSSRRSLPFTQSLAPFTQSLAKKGSSRSQRMSTESSSSDTAKVQKKVPSSSHNKERYPLSEADFQRKIVKLLVEIKAAVSEPSRNSGGLYEREQPPKILTVEELKEFNNKLDDQHEFVKLIDLWMSIGGKDVRTYITKMLASITTNGVLSNLSWEGSNGKKTDFKSLKNILLALKKCAIEKLKTDDSVIKEKLQKVLKDAPDREGGSRWTEKLKQKTK